MIDFGENGTERPLLTLMSKFCDPAHLHPHVLRAARGTGSADAGADQAMLVGRNAASTSTSAMRRQF